VPLQGPCAGRAIGTCHELTDDRCRAHVTICAVGIAEPGASFGDLLRRYRRAAELTQEELAEHAGVSVRSMSDLERGGAQLPRRDTVEMIVRALHLEGDERSTFEAAVARRRGPRPIAVVNGPPGEARASSRAQSPHNMPRQLTSFIGRDQDMTELAHVLDQTPLLTLTGPGGVGKTRLAYALVGKPGRPLSGWCVADRARGSRRSGGSPRGHRRGPGRT